MADVFISHSVQDKPLAEHLAGRLRDAGITVWDENSLLPGSEITSGILEAISDAHVFLCIISDHSITSHWVQSEIAVALSRKDKFIIPIVRKKSTSEPELPFMIRHIQVFTLPEDETSDAEVQKLVSLLKQKRRFLSNNQSQETAQLLARREVLANGISALHQEQVEYAKEQNLRTSKIALKISVTGIASISMSVMILGMLSVVPSNIRMLSVGVSFGTLFGVLIYFLVHQLLLHTSQKHKRSNG
ncbi:MAG: toll/interleukin-1 receptor domain-containing protein [Magnetococcales bacterium]|nr:toll/interleukin-1 receptor domain-containing protein [Magnetococcales bacterium]